MNVYKQPITDSTKNSKKGLLSLELDENGKYVTIEEGRGNADKVTLVWEFCGDFAMSWLKLDKVLLDRLEIVLRAPSSN